jgi:isopentenyldiphosphate isomerase
MIGPFLNADEILDVVDENDNVVGQARRADVYDKGLRHRCTFILATNTADKIFVHRRTATKLAFPSLYDMFVGGVVGTGENYDDAAYREAEEELGVSGLARPEFLFKFRYEEGSYSWWCAVYRVRCDLPVAPQPEEIAWHAFMSEAELSMKLREWQFVPDGLAAWHRLQEWRRRSDRKETMT